MEKTFCDVEQILQSCGESIKKTHETGFNTMFQQSKVEDSFDEIIGEELQSCGEKTFCDTATAGFNTMFQQSKVEDSFDEIIGEEELPQILQRCRESIKVICEDGLPEYFSPELQRDFGNNCSFIYQISTPQKIYPDEILERYVTTRSYSENNYFDESTTSISDLIIDIENSVKCSNWNRGDMHNNQQISTMITEEDYTYSYQNTFILEKQMILSVSPYKNELIVDIRYLDDNLCRMRKGLSLSIHQFQIIVENQELFNQAFERMRNYTSDSENIDISINLGGQLYIYLKFPFQTVHIRQDYLNQDKSVGLLGVSLRWFAWNRFVNSSKIIFAKINGDRINC